MKKANGPKKKKNKLITHLLTMPQAAGKNHGQPTHSKLFSELLNQLRPQNWPADE